MRHLYLAPIVFVVLLTSPALGELRICNTTTEKVSSAFAYHDGYAWVSHGWYILQGNECKTVLAGDLKNKNYYIYAHGGTHLWSGKYAFCVSSDRFTIRGDKNCESRGYRYEQFINVNVGESLSYTARLMCQQGDCTIRPGWTIELPFASSVGGITIDNNQFSAKTTGRVKIDFTRQTLFADAVLNTNLSELQRGLPRIIQNHVNRNDDCNEIIRLHTVGLSPWGRSLRVYAAGHYEDWECPWFETPFGDVELGKHRLYEQDGDMTALLTPQTNGNAVWMHVNVTSMNANGLLGNLLGSNWFGPWIRDMIMQSIPQTIQLGDIQSHLPGALRGFPIQLKDLWFYDAGGGQLGLHVEARVTVSSTYADRVWQNLLQ